MKPIKLTKLRFGLAFGVAGLADLLQIIVNGLIATPYLWTVGELAEYALDMVTAGLTILLLGFHPALFPTFILKVLPGTALLPTWTACVAYVVWSRKDEISMEKPMADNPAKVGEPEPSEKSVPRSHPAGSGAWILVLGAAVLGGVLWFRHRPGTFVAPLEVRASTLPAEIAPALRPHVKPIVAVGPLENLSLSSPGMNAWQPINPRTGLPLNHNPNAESICSTLEDRLMQISGIEVLGKQQMRAFRSELNASPTLSKNAKLRGLLPADLVVLLALLDLHQEQATFKGYGIETKSLKTKCSLRLQVMNVADGAITFSKIADGVAVGHDPNGSTEDFAVAAVNDALQKLDSDTAFRNALLTKTNP